MVSSLRNKMFKFVFADKLVQLYDETGFMCFLCLCMCVRCSLAPCRALFIYCVGLYLFIVH